MSLWLNFNTASVLHGLLPFFLKIVAFLMDRFEIYLWSILILSNFINQIELMTIMSFFDIGDYLFVDLLRFDVSDHSMYEKIDQKQS